MTEKVSNLIDVSNLTKTYKIGKERIDAVKDVTFTVQGVEMISILGHSGSGKTTLLSLIGGLTKPNNGIVKINGTNIWSIKDDELSALRNKKMNFIFQFASLIPTLTAVENVLLPTAFGNTPVDAKEYAMHLLEAVGLKDKVNSYPAHLSGGQQRRVAIARAFINNPEIILADEPSGDLDEQTEEEVMAFFIKMNAEKSITFIIVTHSSTIAKQCQRHYFMQNGALALKDSM